MALPVPIAIWIALNVLSGKKNGGYHPGFAADIRLQEWSPHSQAISTFDQKMGDAIQQLIFPRVCLPDFIKALPRNLEHEDIRYLAAKGALTVPDTALQVELLKSYLLYDFDSEHDQVSVVQSLLLMTCGYETPDDLKSPWHWIGVSLSLSRTIGLNLDQTNSRMETWRKQLWKRVWWSTYTRDTFIAIGMRQPRHVKDHDYNVPLLTVDDFECKRFPAEVLNMLDGCEVLQNVECQRHMALMFVHKCKLCLTVSRDLPNRSSILNHHFGGRAKVTETLIPKNSLSGKSPAMHWYDKLENWKANLPCEIRYISPAGTDMAPAESSLHLHRAFLQMIYLMTFSTIFWPEMLPETQHSTMAARLHEDWWTKVRSAAGMISTIAEDLHKLDLIRYLPTTAVTALLHATIVLLLDLKSDESSTRIASLQRFYQCMRILDRLRELHPPADVAISFLEAVVHKAGLRLSMPEAAKPGVPPGTNCPTVSQPLCDILVRQLLNMPSLLPNTGFHCQRRDNEALIIREIHPYLDGGGWNLDSNVHYNELELWHGLNNSSDQVNDVQFMQNVFDGLFDTEARLFAGQEGLFLDRPHI
ncbi:hypothetical protein PENARI_c051G07863 [Penicillium arizonense]|uniref:Xylanolytic transcriptional activator regulatory domain-containing protein n=1 Tax=Penicillium arizonense TaxID=1835702 RepID=A0A1F5L216_PENAI|nr:hypothetical protein PENARI_c051G07863 [Penicillium arizonense]OGE47273.1 hypothetical protein PENARI_c051G07863 [Penicillium arizonense]